jgi:hypothetical protein
LSRSSNGSFPGLGVEWTNQQVVDYLDQNGYSELRAYIERVGFPPNRFKTDGCSVVSDELFGVDMIPCCLPHDIWDWAGRVEDESEFKPRADKDFSRCTETRLRENARVPRWLRWIISRVRWFGVTIGGGSQYKNPKFSWGFGWLERR